MHRTDDMVSGKAQPVPRGRWKACKYRVNDDGTMTVLIGAKVYTLPKEQVKPR